MSFIIYPVKCRKCGHKFDTAFGVVGTRLIAQPAKRCPKCKSKNFEKPTFRTIDTRRHKKEVIRDKNGYV